LNFVLALATNHASQRSSSDNEHLSFLPRQGCQRMIISKYLFRKF
jgi:hypothetical protein